jgi:hypothetical protein
VLANVFTDGIRSGNMELLHHKFTKVIVIILLITSKLGRKRKSMVRTLLRTFIVVTKRLFEKYDAIDKDWYNTRTLRNLFNVQLMYSDF